MGSIQFIVNATAGSGASGTLFKEAERIMDARGIQYQASFTQYKRHAIELTQDALASGASTIVAVGGDGTVNEVASALYGSDAVMGVFPFGTGNDLARTLGFPTDPEAALGVVLLGHSEPLDAGLANDRFFINVAGFGFDVDVLLAMEKYKPNHRGMMPYLLGVLDALKNLRALHVTMRHGGEVSERETTIVSIGNGQYVGGGMHAVPFADPHDGLLDILVVKRVGRFKLLRLLPSFIKGKHTHLRVVEYFRTDAITFETREDCAINVDGEVDLHMPATFRVLPNAIRMLVPAP